MSPRSPRAAEHAAMANRVLKGATVATQFVGSKHFHRCDYYAHHRPNFFTSVKMYSKVTINAECVNGEGKKSWYLADGANPSYGTGNEYNGVFPAWDWGAIPGTTEWQGGSRPVDCRVNVALGTAPASVCGVSTGLYGAAAMQLRTGNLFGSTNPMLSAKKAWFFFDFGWVALGANITTSGAGPADAQVCTTLEQVPLVGSVYSSSSPSAAVPSGVDAVCAGV